MGISWEKRSRSRFIGIQRDVPVNVLLLLKNYSKGVQERIFTYERKGQFGNRN